MANRKIYGIHPSRPEYVAKIKGDAGRYPIWGLDWYNNRAIVSRAGALELISFDKIAFEMEHENEEKEIRLFQCVKCKHLYHDKIASCDCTAGEPFEYTDWIARPAI